MTFALDGATVGTALLANNTARVTHTGAVAAGTHTITAAWPGDATHPGVKLMGSHIVTLPTTAGQSDFTLTASTTTLTAYTVDDVTLTVRAAQIGSFTDSLNLTVTGQQARLSATASPTNISLGAATSGTALIKIHTGLSPLALNRSPLGSAGKLAAFAGLPFGLLLAARKRRAGTWLLLAIAMVLCGAVTGCSVPPTDIGLAPGVYHLHVTATGAQTAVTHSVDVTLTVNQFPPRT